MLLLPYSTDAPIYHYPFATAGIIAVNIGVFFATTFQLLVGNVEVEQIDWLILQFNQINPLQWITNNFMHVGFMHLFCNMFFLWAFGLVVEGKIGSLKFLGLYMFMGAVYGAIVQIPMFLISGEGGALGASGVIFSLMMIALLWAPENEIECFYWVFTVAGMFEVRIVKLAGIFLFIQLMFLWLGGFSMSSEMLHLAGAVVGAPVGLWMLRSEQVDCEDWDLISRNEWLQEYKLFCSEKRRLRLQQKEDELHDPVAAALQSSTSTSTSASARAAAQAGTLTPRAERKQAAAKTVRTSEKRGLFGNRNKDKADRQASSASHTSASHPDFNRLSILLRQAIDSNSATMAEQHFGKLEQLKIADGLSTKTLFAYIKVLANATKWSSAMRPLQIVIARGGPNANDARLRVAHIQSANDARLRVAHIQLNVMRAPGEAVKTLQQIRVDPQSPKEAQSKVQHYRDAMMTKCVALSRSARKEPL